MTFRPTSPVRGAVETASTEAVADRAASLVETVLAGVVYREVTLPRTDIKGAMRLLRRAEETKVRATARRQLETDFGITDAGPNVELYPEYRELWRVHFIAIAVRNPADVTQPLMTFAEWAECDDVQLLALWTAYQDLEAELDPLGPTAPPLTEEEAGAIRAAAKKGDPDLLTSFGSRRLALFAITTAVAPST